MKKNTFLVLFLALGIVGFSACEDDTDPQAATTAPTVNRLIFESNADSGGHLKVELKDSHLESLLDGNKSGVVTPLLIPSSYVLPEHQSSVEFTLTDVNYYGETVSEIVCASGSDSKLPLLWQGPLGEYYEGSNGYLYLDDTVGGLQYILQGTNEIITDAVIVSYFYADCTASDSQTYRVSFYPSNDVLSHGITTSFSVDSGTFTGIVRLHRIGDGHTPFIDLLF